MNKRLVVIDVWITLLLILVIVGHCMFPNAPEWYLKLHERIYSFHMAAFYFICGFLVSYRYKPLSSLKEYTLYINKRLIKFGIPFLLFGISLCIYHAIRASDSRLNALLLGIKYLFLETTRSPAIYLWFILVLLFYYILAPIFCQFERYSIIPSIIIAIVLNYYPLPRLFCLHLFSRYLLFFLLGIIINRFSSSLNKIPFWVSFFSLPPFVVSICLINNNTLLISLLSLPANYCISCCLSKSSSVITLSEFLSKRCFAIYLWQMIFIHILAIVIRPSLGPDCRYALFIIAAVPFAIASSLLASLIVSNCRNKLLKCASLG